jgi:hypothetical protein
LMKFATEAFLTLILTAYGLKNPFSQKRK